MRPGTVSNLNKKIYERIKRWRNRAINANHPYVYLRYLKKRGLKGIRLFVSDACLALIESNHEFYPGAKWQRCVVHFYRNVFSVVPRRKVKQVAMMLKAIHASEDCQAAVQKPQAVVEKLEVLKLRQAAKMVRDTIIMISPLLTGGGLGPTTLLGRS